MVESKVDRPLTSMEDLAFIRPSRPFIKSEHKNVSIKI